MPDFGARLKISEITYAIMQFCSRLHPLRDACCRQHFVWKNQLLQGH